MDTKTISPGLLRPTDSYLPNLQRVNQLATILRQGRVINPVIVVETENQRKYIVSGHHVAYAYFLADRQAEARIIKTDQDVMSCRLGRAGSVSSIAALVKSCESGNQDLMETFGIELVPDYARMVPLYQKMPEGRVAH